MKKRKIALLVLIFLFLHLLNIHNNTILVIISLVTYFIVDDFTDSFFLIKETIWRL